MRRARRSGASATGWTLRPSARRARRPRDASSAHGRQQDRLIKEMRLLGLSDDASANAYVTATYLPQHNAGLRRPVGQPGGLSSRPRSAAARRRYVLSRGTPDRRTRLRVHYHRQSFQLDRAARGRVPVKSRSGARRRTGGCSRIPNGPVHRAAGSSHCGMAPRLTDRLRWPNVTHRKQRNRVVVNPVGKLRKIRPYRLAFVVQCTTLLHHARRNARGL